MQIKERKLTFVCTCNGCLGISKEYHYSHVSGILTQLNGHYFSESTRRFFGARVTGFRVLYAERGVIVFSTQKAGFDDSAGREINHAYFCRYGNLATDYHYKTAKDARKGLFEGIEKIAGCNCHGCQIDRAGR